MSTKVIVVVNTNPSPALRSGTRAIVRTLQRMTAPGTQVLERHFHRLAGKTIHPSAVVLGPQGVPFQSYEDNVREDLFGLVRSLECPVLGICGGHQAFALAHGGELGPVHGGALPNDGSYGTLQKARGFGLVHYVAENKHLEDPLLRELPNPSRFFASHVESIRQLPCDFTVLATGVHNTIQIVRRDGTPQYGVQFHPERGGTGRQLLRNFLDLAQMPIP
jgi:GMP synthase (glutamine-hydrolysing)